MSANKNHLKLHCSLTKFLEEASTHKDGSKAAVAAVLLSDLGYFGNEQVVSGMKEELAVFVECGHQEAVSEIASICKACSKSAGCSVGGVILSSYPSDPNG